MSNEFETPKDDLDGAVPEGPSEVNLAEEGQEDIGRVKLPRGKQSFGILEQRLGGSRMRVRCMDGKIRICRVPGRLKRKLWVREGDVLLIEPWELGGDDKGDVIFKYRPNQVAWLKKNGYLKELENFEEF
jgi:translation initiation factor 1A